MNVLAALDGGPRSADVLGAARELATSLGATARVVHVRATAEAVAAVRSLAPDVEVLDGDPAPAILDEADRSAATAVVLGSDVRSDGLVHGDVAVAVLTRSPRPVLVVPPSCRIPHGVGFRRVLLPLEGTDDTATAVADVAGRLVLGGAEVVAAHVFGPATAPRFWDQPGHAGPTWASAFLGRWWGQDEVQLHVRRGELVPALLDVVGRERVDLVVLGWGRDLAGGHAEVVREMVARADVPTLLVPVRRAEVPAAGSPDRGSDAR